jgi:hypothetical protein
MGETFLDAESKVCSATNQALYFFDKLKEVRKGRGKSRVEAIERASARGGVIIL